MSGYKIILACLSDVDTVVPTLGVSFLIGCGFGAHIEALHVRADAASAVPLVGEGMSGAMVEEMLEIAERQATDRSERVRQLFDRTCAEQGIVAAAKPAPGSSGPSVAWREEVGREEDVIAYAGRLADLLVFARPFPDKDIPSIISLNAALMESGRPLLLAPPTLPSQIGQTIAVFWNGSAEASRAVAAALPFLERAAKVIVLCAREEEPAAHDELANYLGWHGIVADVRTFVAGGGGGHVGQGLLLQANAVGADLIVMGAYTHSRLRQLILGGVTRHVIHAARVPVLLSH
jgi:nucleotide-binding universal stress UspA family protein